MYQVENEINIETLGRIIRKFQLNELPKIKKAYNYYEGKQAITLRKDNDMGKPNNKVMVNYCHNIVQNYQGYLTGKSITYNAKNDELTNIFNYNDIVNEDNDFLRNALICGRSFEICYVDEDGKQRFRQLNPLECIPVYDTTLSQNLLYVIRFYKETIEEKTQSDYIVEVYGAEKTVIYRSNIGFSSFSLIEEHPNYYTQCPIVVFSLNTDETSIFNQVYSLQDAYNSLLSDEVNDFDAFSDAYLLLKGVQLDEEDLDLMRDKRCLMVDTDANAEYLTKNISDTQIQNMLQNVNDQIHKIANSPDFNDEKFLAQSGIAMKFKLTGFENAASSIETNMRKALQRRIELLCDLIALSSTETVWRDVEITFTRNLPENITDAANVVSQLQGIVSQETLLALLPFVRDIKAEQERIEAEKSASTEVYAASFGGEE